MKLDTEKVEKVMISSAQMKQLENIVKSLFSAFGDALISSILASIISFIFGVTWLLCQQAIFWFLFLSGCYAVKIGKLK